MAGTEARTVGVSDLRGIIVDSDELQKGTRIFDEKGIKNLSRHENKLFCEAAGSGTAPYKVALVFADASVEVKARCTCMAARSRPFCKHAAALLVAWSRAPESFVVSEAPPVGAGGEAKKKAVKRGATETASLMKQGVDQVGTLVRELGVAGVAAIGEERAPQIQKLGENLRENKLRRLSAKTLDLVKLLEASLARRGSLPAIAYTELMADLLLTARKLEKHLGGEPIDDRHVEELIGKTWKKDDRKALSGLDLVEYAYLVRTTSDDFVIRESRFFDAASGAHYSEKQIVPGFLAKRTDPKRSRAGDLLVGVRGSAYPGYPPLRLEVADLGDPKPLDHGALERLVERALPDVGSALAGLQEHRKDVFAPDLLPVAIRVDTLLSRGTRMQAVDATGQALHLAEDARLEERLGSALRGARLVLLLGDVGIEAALPTLWPHAVVVEGSLGLELLTLVAPEHASTRVALPAEGSAAWNEAARAAGASAAAIALAEVREELADSFVVGLAALSARATEPLAARLGELGLGKQAALLRAIAEKSEPEARLDDFVKLYQILGMALVRLAGATAVDREAMERVPTYESVFVNRPSRWLEPRDTARLRAQGTLSRYEAAVQYAHHYESLSADELAGAIYPTWADGSAAPYVVRAFAGRAEAALTAAKSALSSRRGRMAKITALHVLESIGSQEALRVLRAVAGEGSDVGLRALAADARDALELKHGGRDAVKQRRAAAQQKLTELTQVLLSAPTKDVREAAISGLVELGHRGALPVLRQTFLGDASHEVRREAAIGLALLGDTEMVETFVRMLADRQQGDAREAKVAADALGLLGDVRGLSELLAAFAEGYKPSVVAEALRAMGPVALDPLIALVEAEPAIAGRKAALSVLEQLPDQDLTLALVGRLADGPKDATFAERAALYLKLAAVHPDCRRAVAKAVLEGLPDPDANKALVKAAKKALG